MFRANTYRPMAKRPKWTFLGQLLYISLLAFSIGFLAEQLLQRVAPDFYTPELSLYLVTLLAALLWDTLAKVTIILAAIAFGPSLIKMYQELEGTQVPGAVREKAMNTFLSIGELTNKLEATLAPIIKPAVVILAATGAVYITTLDSAEAATLVSGLPAWFKTHPLMIGAVGTAILWSLRNPQVFELLLSAEDVRGKATRICIAVCIILFGILPLPLIGFALVMLITGLV